MRVWFSFLCVALSCGGNSSSDPAGTVDGSLPGAADSAPNPTDYPAPADWGPLQGPGGPSVSFTEEEIGEHCAYLDGGPQDISDHHNLVTMYDGWLLLPWSPEVGSGGMTFFDVSNPCQPTVHGSGQSSEMRESHSIGFSSQGGQWAVTNGIDGTFVATKGGILFWDLSDLSAPSAVKLMNLPGFLYPDAYDRVTLSVFWQVPYVFVGGGDNGVYVVDASDPLNPELVKQVTFDPVMRVGQVQAIGDLLVVTTAEQPRTVLLDISDPTDPQPITGGDFLARDTADGDPKEAYFTNTEGGYIYYARKEGAGGLIVYDIHDPTTPTWTGALPSDGNGSYVFLHEGHAFVGESSFAAIYDVRDPSNMSELMRLDLEGDLDTITPVGNIAVLSVDDGANTNQGTAMAPWQMAPDTVPPTVTWLWPKDGSTLSTTSSIGITLSEFVEVKSAWRGSVRLYESTTGLEVPGLISAQENIVNFRPSAPLKADTAYTFEIPAGGLQDFSGNAIAAPFTASFQTN